MKTLQTKPVLEYRIVANTTNPNRHQRLKINSYFRGRKVAQVHEGQPSYIIPLARKKYNLAAKI